MNVAGLVLGVLGARTAAVSIVERIENFRQAPETFGNLTGLLENLNHDLDKVDEVLNKIRNAPVADVYKFPNEPVADLSSLFKARLDRVHKSLCEVDATIKKDFSKVFTRSGGEIVGKWRSTARRMFRASSLSDKMASLELKVKESSNQLQHLTTQLTIALNSLEFHNAVIPEFKKLKITDSPDEVYRPASSAPALPHTVNLNFYARDAGGNFTTPEAMLKHEILSSKSPARVTAATGAVTTAVTLPPAYGVVGMAGVGKTIALRGLATDDEISLRFPDGVLYMAFGQRANDQDAIEEIADIMKRTGASSSLADVRSSTSLKEAVNLAVQWFHGKVCLFLVDDLWPIEGCVIGHFNDLRQLLRCSQDSRMAISTRSVSIAIGAGCVVDFAARNPLVSANIFMTYATCSMPRDAVQGLRHDLCPSVPKILSFCGGLPIALSITGSAVAYLIRTSGTFENACEIYVTDFEHRARNLVEEENPEGKRLSDCISLSLQYLETEFSDWKKRNSVNIDFSVSDLYASLCVLKNHVWVPVSVLSRLWQLGETSALDIADMFCRMSLASLTHQKIGDEDSKRAGITLHDLHLDYCRQVSKNSEYEWHAALLHGYLKSSSDALCCDPCTLSSKDLVGLLPRPWWSDTILDDGYIHAHLARHLSLSGQGSELAALLLDARWMAVRGKFGGILGLKTDFGIVEKLFRTSGRTAEVIHSTGIRESFELLFKAIQLSWGRFLEGQRPYQFQMCGRLLNKRSEDGLVDAVINSFEAHTPRPYLKPVSSFFPELKSAQIMEIPVGGSCKRLTCSPCGKYIAAGSGQDIVLADVNTGDVLKRLLGNSRNVNCICFIGGWKRIASASGDKTVSVWEWEKSDSPVLVLEGHSDVVYGVAASKDGERIFSVSKDGTLRVWKGNDGSAVNAFDQGRGVRCVALCSDNRKVAISLECGTLKVLDCGTGVTLFEDAEANVSWSVAFSPDGQRLAAGGWDPVIRVWDTERWAAIGSPVEGHAKPVISVAFSPNGLRMVSGSWDKTLRLWDVAPLNSVASSSTIMRLCNTAVFSSDSVDSVTFALGGERIITGSDYGFVRIWDAHFNATEEKGRFAHSRMACDVSISSDGLRVASAGRDGTVLLWNTQTGVQIGTPLQGHTNGVTCVSFSPDRRQLVSGSLDKTLRLWDAGNFIQLGNSIEAHSDAVLCASFSADGLRIVSGGNDNTVRLWNAETRKQMGNSLVGHTEGMRPVAESSDGQYVVSRGWNADIIIWDRCNNINCLEIGGPGRQHE